MIHLIFFLFKFYCYYYYWFSVLSIGTNWLNFSRSSSSQRASDIVIYFTTYGAFWLMNLNVRNHPCETKIQCRSAAAITRTKTDSADAKAHSIRSLFLYSMFFLLFFFASIIGKSNILNATQCHRFQVSARLCRCSLFSMHERGKKWAVIKMECSHS